MLPYQLVVRETSLQMLADHVNVLEVSLNEVVLVDRRHATGVINGINDIDGESNRVCGGETQDRAPLLGGCAGRGRLAPDLADCLAQERPARSEVGFRVPDSGLNQRLVAESCLHRS